MPREPGSCAELGHACILSSAPADGLVARTFGNEQVSTAPRTKDYVLLVPDLPQPRYLDPTDASGHPSAWPHPGLPWPVPSDPALAYINEPPARGDVNVRFGDAHSADRLEVRFVAARELKAGEGAPAGRWSGAQEGLLLPLVFPGERAAALTHRAWNFGTRLFESVDWFLIGYETGFMG